VVGEIIPGKEFTIRDKYLSEGRSVIPARLSKPRQTCPGDGHRGFSCLRLAGWAGDFLMEPEGKRRIFLNEVNTMPGFTKSACTQAVGGHGAQLQGSDYAAN